MLEGDAAASVSRCRPALGTFVEIEIESMEDDMSLAADARLAAVAAIDAAYAAIARVDAAMSFHREGSDLSRLNRSQAGDVIAVDAWTIDVLRLAAGLQRDTDGIFNCAVGSELVSSGLLPGRTRGGGSGCVLDDLVILDERHVQIMAPVCLDLGGIAKGYAVDRAIDVLRLQGARQARVNAGGDLRILGPRPQPIHIRSVAQPGRFHGACTLADGAIATSSTFFSGGTDPCGHWRSALIDPRTSRPVTARHSFSVIAELCAIADGLTKVVAVTGRTDHPSLQRHGASAFIL